MFHQEWGIYVSPVFQEKTLTHYWHLCVWGVKCYITQRSEKSKRLEAEMEREEECFSRNEIGSAEENEKKYCSLSQWLRAVWRECLQENLRGMQSSCVMCRCFHVCVCVRDRLAAGMNKTSRLNMKKCDLYSTSPHIFQIYIFTSFVQWIYLLCVTCLNL